MTGETAAPTGLPKVRACGVIVFRNRPEFSFLLMRHRHRFDLPKGHMEHGETDLECALREMEEETGIPRDLVDIDPQFRYEEVYYPFEARFGPGQVEKTLVIFLGWIKTDPVIRPTEHGGFEWRKWSPPHDIQRFTVNPLLASLEKYFSPQHGLGQVGDTSTPAG